MRNNKFHIALARYFQTKPLYFDKFDDWNPNTRKLAEQPWQQLCSGQWDLAIEKSLTDFPFVIIKIMAGLIEGLFEDYLFADRLVPFEKRKQLNYWIAFFREKIYILRRGNKGWPEYKIFLQLAVEQADNSPLTIGAENWLTSGNYRWYWLRQTNRKSRIELNPCIAVFEGHSDEINGALETRNGNFISWPIGYTEYSNENTIRLWNQSGKLLASFEGHNDTITGVFETSERNILSWSKDDGTIIIWDKSGKIITKIMDRVDQVIETFTGGILTWSKYGDKEILRDKKGSTIALLEGLKYGRDGVLVTCQGNILAWSYDAIGWWDNSGKAIAFFEESVAGAIETCQGNILTWSKNGKIIRIWDDSNKKITLITPNDNGSEFKINGAIETVDDNILAWSKESETLLFLNKGGKIIALWEGHNNVINGVIETHDRNILSWSKDGTLRLWDTSGKTLILFVGHISQVVNAIETREGYFISEGSPAYELRN